MSIEKKVESVNEKISTLTEKETINIEDLYIDDESIADIVFNINDNELKLNLLADLMLLDVKFNQEDTLKILQTNDKNIISSMIINNKNDEVMAKNMILSLMDENINKETFLLVSRSFMNVVTNNARDVISTFVNNSTYINEKDNDKLFLLLLVHDKSPISNEDKDNFEKFLSFNMAEKANAKLFKMLLSTKINMHSVNELNENGLFYLNGKNNETIKEKHKILIESGIDVSLKNKEGKSYLEKNTILEDAITRIDKKRKIALN